MTSYPSMVKACPYGKCLVATMDLLKGTAVEKFEGIVIKHDRPIPCHREFPTTKFAIS